MAGCGHSSAPTPTQVDVPAPRQRDYTNYYPPGTHRAAPRAVRIIEAWSDALRAGHVKLAARWFDRPVVVQNASPLRKLTTRRQIFDFNNTLPCGAHAVKTIAGHRYTVTTFVLTERPGSRYGCGSTGRLVAVAFLFRHGKISAWRQVEVPPPLGPAENLGSASPDAS